MTVLAPPDTPALELLADRRKLTRAAASVGAAAGTERLDVGASLLCDAWAWALAECAVVGLVRDRRVPDVAPANVALVLRDDGAAAGVRLLESRGACRAGDPARRPGDVELAGDDALIVWMLGRLAAHLAPLVDELHALSRRPRTALWRSAGDRVLHAFVWAGEELGCRREAWALGERCAALGGTWPGPARYRLLRHAGGAYATRTRNGCCLHWRGADGRHCFTYPLTDDAERVERLEARA